MASKKNRIAIAYGLRDDNIEVMPIPIVSDRAPTTGDSAVLGSLWIDKTLNDAYILTSVSTNIANWENIGGGSSDFSAVTVDPGNVTITTGDLVLSAQGAGTLRTAADGTASSLADGTDGQVLISATGSTPAWATITAGAGITVTDAANSITIEATGATSSSYTLDAGGPVVPLAGVLDVIGYDANITTDGNTANTIKIRLSDDITTVGALSAGVDLAMSSGQATITSSVDAVESIYLHADAGTSETVRIHSDQGTSATSVDIESDVGGISLVSGLAAANSLTLNASDAAGGIDIDFGTGGLSMVGANGAINLESGTAAINIGADAAAHTVTVGSTTTTAATVIQSGTGDVNVTSTDAINVDATGVLELNSSGGVIGIGNDAVSQNINIGTAGARAISIGNSTGATSVDIDCGTGVMTLGSNAIAHAVTLGSVTGAAATTIQSGSGAMTFTAGGIFDVNATGAVTVDGTTMDFNGSGAINIDSSAGAISIGSDDIDQAVNIGTDGERTVTVGSVNGAAAATIQSGSGAMTFTAGGAFDVNATGNVTIDGAIIDLNSSGAVTVDGTTMDFNGTGAINIDSSVGAIGIGTDAVDLAVNIGTAGARVVTVGSTTGAADLTLQAGSAGMTLSAAGLVDVVPATDSQAGAACTVNTNVGVATFTGLTTAAAGSQELTVTNSLCTTGSAILCSLSALGANDAQMTITRVKPAAGSFVVTATNNGAAALNGDLILTFWLIA